MSPTRIGVLHVVHSLNVGGAEKLVFDLALRTDPRRFAVSVACLDEAGKLAAALGAQGIPIEVLHRLPGVDFGLVGRLRRVISHHGVSVVHAHQYTPFFYGVTAARLAGVACVFTEHGRHHPDVRKPKRVAANQVLARLASASVAVSEFTRQALISNDGFPASGVRVIYNGVDVSARSTVDRSAARAHLGLPAAGPLIGLCARLSPEKNVPLLLDAFAQVRAERPDAHLVLAGDGPVRTELEAQVASQGLADSVRFLGFVTDVPVLMAALDVFALSSVTEGTSVTLLEAMFAARPAVVTAVGGNPEIVVEGQTGYLVPSGDVAAMARRLLQLLADEPLSARLGAAGKARVLERFTFEGMVRAYEELYVSSV